MRKFGWLSVVVLVGLVGCDRVVSSTDLAGDASYRRTVKFTHTASPMGQDEGKITDLIKFQGGGWTTTTEKKDANETLTATRQVPIGASGEELSLMAKGKEMLTAKVVATKLPSGEIDYTETYTWVGPVKKSNDDNDEKQRQKAAKEIRAAAPSITTEQADAFSREMDEQLSHMLLGPARPMLMTLVAQPELAAKDIRARIFVLTRDYLVSKAGMATDAATKSARKFVLAGFDDKSLSSSAPTPPSDPNEKNDDPSMTLIQSEVKFPGTLVTTDGESDPVDGTVFWAFYASAAQKHPVVLHLRIKP